MDILKDAFIAVGILSGLTGVLALALVVAERYIGQFGDFNLLINGEKEVTVQGGKSLLASLSDLKIFIPSACGGKATCGYCKVKVLSGGGPILATEEPYLSESERAQNVRLSCCVRVRSDMEMQIPEEILSLKEYETRVDCVSDLTHDVKEVRLALVEPDNMDFRPGQYVQFKIPAYGEVVEPVYRAYSIASSASEKSALEFVIRLAPKGIATTYIFERLKEGDALMINGPYGEFLMRDTDAEVLMIAGSTGIAPFRSMLHEFVERGIQRPCTLFFGCVEESDLFYVDEMASFEESLPNFQFVPALSAPGGGSGWTGERGLITDVVDRHVKEPSSAEGYLCGSPGMIDACVQVLEAKGITEDRISFDKFA